MGKQIATGGGFGIVYVRAGKVFQARMNSFQKLQLLLLQICVAMVASRVILGMRFAAFRVSARDKKQTVPRSDINGSNSSGAHKNLSECH